MRKSRAKQTVSIIIPCCDEESNIKELLGRIREEKKPVCFDYEIIFIDDGSTDKTPEILKRLLELNLSSHMKDNKIVIRVITHEGNLGLGRALCSGFLAASGDIIITMDCDLSHDVRLLPNFIEEILDGHDLVIGSRYVRDGGTMNVPLWRVWASILARVLLPCDDVSDKTSGYRAYSKMVKRINIERNGFESQLEILLKIKKMGGKIKEIPVVLVPRRKGKSKFSIFKVAWKYMTFLMMR